MFWQGVSEQRLRGALRVRPPWRCFFGQILTKFGQIKPSLPLWTAFFCRSKMVSKRRANMVFCKIGFALFLPLRHGRARFFGGLFEHFFGLQNAVAIFLDQICQNLSVPLWSTSNFASFLHFLSQITLFTADCFFHVFVKFHPFDQSFIRISSRMQV